MNGSSSPGMIALLMMTLIIELILRGAFMNYLMSTFTLLTWALIAESKVSALAWFPAILVLTWIRCDGPEPLPPEQGNYTQRRLRETTDNWITQKVTRLWKNRTAEILYVASIGTGRMDRVNSFRYQSYSNAERKRTTRKHNRKLAMSHKLLMITCMTAANIGRATAFDCDSKRIAIDNCSSKCLTNSKKDFIPGRSIQSFCFLFE
jgi:hypothetical protein